jgi:hypothetical protein
MAWRSESWADIVARAGSSDRHARRRAVASDEDRISLAARAEPWSFAAPPPPIEVGQDGIRIGGGLHSVEIALSQLHHVEPVDPWPAIALGWVDRGQPYRTIVAPPEDEVDVERYAAAIDALFAALAPRMRAVLSPGWLAIPEVRWERVDAIPGEPGAEPPPTGGYRAAPGELDPVIARRTTARGAASLWTWLWARLAGAPRRIDPRELVLTKRFVYARTRGGERLRIDASTLRTGRLTPAGDLILVFGRSTALLLAHQEGCALATELSSRVPIEPPRAVSE